MGEKEDFAVVVYMMCGRKGRLCSSGVHDVWEKRKTLEKEYNMMLSRSACKRLMLNSKILSGEVKYIR